MQESIECFQENITDPVKLDPLLLGNKVYDFLKSSHLMYVFSEVI